MHYPAEKDDLMKKAKVNDAPEEIKNLINKFTNKTYNSPIDITKEMSKIKNA
jgi:hypothetical protein